MGQTLRQRQGWLYRALKNDINAVCGSMCNWRRTIVFERDAASRNNRAEPPGAGVDHKPPSQTATVTDQRRMARPRLVWSSEHLVLSSRLARAVRGCSDSLTASCSNATGVRDYCAARSLDVSVYLQNVNTFPRVVWSGHCSVTRSRTYKVLQDPGSPAETYNQMSQTPYGQDPSSAPPPS